MKAIQIADGVFRISANIGSRDLFEGIWPIPNGVSLNSYLVRGGKNAFIDLVKDWDGAPGQLQEQLDSIGLSFRDIHYLVLNHMEPDHTGWLKELHGMNPEIEIIASRKSVPLIKNFYGITERVRAVDSGDRLDLGGGKTLVFEDIPNVHWPETMVTYELSTGVLFSCDAFGSFGRVGEAVFDDQLSVEQAKFFEEETLRYYSNIVSTFSVSVERAIEKLGGLTIHVIAPSHGIIWRSNPKAIIDLYSRYASWYKGPAEKEITLVWSSMYGNTERSVKAIMDGVSAEGLPLHVHRVPQEHVSWVLSSAWKSSGIIIGMPTYEYRMFPPMAHVLDIFDRSHVTGRKSFRFGSYGWSGGAQKQFDEFNKALKWECLEPVEYPGAPTEADLAACYDRARELARLVKAQ